MTEDFKNKFKEILGDTTINLVLFGETHGFLNDGFFQEEIIKIFGPTILVYEMLEEESLVSKKEQEDFLGEDDEKDFSVISTFGELKNTIRLAMEHDLPVYGNDIKNMCRENRDFLKKAELSEEEERKEEEILLKREMKQARKIAKLLERGEKVFVTTGAFHLREDSILSNLDVAEDYVIFCPTYKGEQLFTPPKNFDINKVSFEPKVISKNG